MPEGEESPDLRFAEPEAEAWPETLSLDPAVRTLARALALTEGFAFHLIACDSPLQAESVIPQVESLCAAERAGRVERVHIEPRALQSNLDSERGASTFVDDVITWLEKKASSGEVGGATARLAATSLRKFSELLTGEEPRSAEYVQEHLTELVRRWHNLNQGKKSDTGRTYQARARWALESFFAWQADPSAFRFSQPKERAKPQRKPSQRMPAGDKESSESTVIAYPLGDNRAARIEIPIGGISTEEVHRLAWVLFGYASDFDPKAAQVGLAPRVTSTATKPRDPAKGFGASCAEGVLIGGCDRIGLRELRQARHRLPRVHGGGRRSCARWRAVPAKHQRLRLAWTRCLFLGVRARPRVGLG